MIANIEIILPIMITSGFVLTGLFIIIEYWQHAKHLRKLKEETQENHKRSKIL